MDADGVHKIEWSITNEHLPIKDTRTLDAVYIATKDESVRSGILPRQPIALDHETANVIDMDAIQAIR